VEDEILREFVVEATEALDMLDVELIELEGDPESTATLSSIFRRVHTIKGTCGFLGFARLEAVTHTGENLLAKLRDGEILATPAIVSVLLELVDVVRETMSVIVMTGRDGDGDDTVLLDKLTALANGDAGTVAAPVEQDEPEVAERVSDIASVRIGDILAEAGALSPGDVDRALASQSEGDPRHVGEILVGWGLVTPDEALAAINTQQQRAQHLPSATTVGDQSIRVDVQLLDTLMNLVGELVLNRNQILQHTTQMQDVRLVATLQRLDRITTELQDAVMQTRMQPIENAWAKYPRVVRDLAKLCGKEVGLRMHGHETELDKTLLEAVKDPLTHIVRNAIDHGIESPQVRDSRGKDRKGLVSLNAYHESGQVIIEVSDDGGGIDPIRVRDLAVAHGVITPARAEKMSRREMAELVFAPGFSTAEDVSNLSGRGVGMDVVRTNIEQIGGTVDLQSSLGEGTTIRLKIPLTLAIIPALVVRCEGASFAIPQVSLLELVRLNGGPDAVESVHGAPVYRLRGTLLPLVFLNEQLSDSHVEPSGDHIVVLQSGEGTFGLVVDEVEDTSEIVVKPLGKLLREIAMFSGATIMGDGRIALILDVVGIAAQAGFGNEHHGSHVKTDLDQGLLDADAQPLLLFRLSSARTFALPLSQVVRLEEFDPTAIERSGGEDVVQCRDHILPLRYVADVLEGGRRPDRAPQKPVRVIIHNRDGRDVGLVVGTITDIVHQHLTVAGDAEAPGLSGSAVIDGVVTDVVDIDGLLECLGTLTTPPT
jgi:two-component system chemotaxis sensor kinase CheA